MYKNIKNLNTDVMLLKDINILNTLLTQEYDVFFLSVNLQLNHGNSSCMSQSYFMHSQGFGMQMF